VTADSGHGVPGPAGVTDARAHVYVERLDDLLSVGGPDGHHLQRVRRLRPGECFTASDGWGRWRRYVVEHTESGVVVGRYGSDVLHDVSPVPSITIACALTKGERPEMVVQKVTELGVDRVLFVATARSVVQWDEYKAVAQLERLHRIAREAGAQSRRARIPVVEGPVALVELRAQPGLVVGALDGDPVDRAGLPTADEWIVAVGPEGGFSTDEADLLAAAPRLAVGRHVLRSETAAIALAAALVTRRGA
jgi:16S rRNA (uracil1498-N3)-methyltransferase